MKKKLIKDLNENKEIANLKIIIIFFVILFFLIPQYHPAKLFKSKKQNKGFNSNYIPKILFHLTDTHTNTNHDSRLKKNGSIIFLNSFIKYEPDLILLTGDITDNFKDSNHLVKVGTLSYKDWEIYNKTIRSLISKYPVIDVAGNHDLYTVDSAISEKNLFLDYSFMFNRTNVKSEDDFIIKKVKMMNLIKKLIRPMILDFLFLLLPMALMCTLIDIN